MLPNDKRSVISTFTVKVSRRVACKYVKSEKNFIQSAVFLLFQQSFQERFNLLQKAHIKLLQENQQLREQPENQNENVSRRVTDIMPCKYVKLEKIFIQSALFLSF